jgi:probable rRNA maturation factor
MMRTLPQVEVRNAQRRIVVSMAKLRAFSQVAGDLAWAERRPHSEIKRVGSILISLVSDREMARLHERFCGITGPTDVLTFQHGEIVISAETAARQARAYHSSLSQELRLYILHGLLHLCGYDDRTRSQQLTMKRTQRDLLEKASELGRRHNASSP